MAEEDFDIDIYGDAGPEGDSRQEDANANAQAYESNSAITVANGSNNSTSHTNNQSSFDADVQDDNQNQNQTAASARDSSSTPAQSHQQGVKRKEGPDDRPIDPGATNCILLSELSWWTTDDDIRSFVRQASCEDELKDITFSEHKVNGKSKGQAYIELTSQQAATATKHAIETSESTQPGGKKPTIIYSSPNNNPFRTLPKDGPTRANKDQGSRGGAMSGGYNDRGSSGGNFGGGYNRGGRGGFNGPRGGFNRNFSGGNMNGGYNNNNNNPMGGGGFPMGGGNFGGYNNPRGGGMMGRGMHGGPNNMRGGRGGGMNPAMNNMMGGMMPGMGGMGMPLGGAMPMGGFPSAVPNYFNFGGNQQGDWNQNPHGAKRPRGE
ncbi:hypothetical protein MGN70_013531 [Eutypa lata]|uniref:Putative rrm domain-containing protein n=1 Tax=Eutypa lata (strain UCR-EL1) TaxID=1287681 RepID=M7SL94_EUTLA|nr:putative rrm domain-containing protein [Eutypa lata UCREL1]KAI1246630.1 hypothetical protein MGN70_013531 [Eutypa lata]